jgi:hypothetical protein
MWQCGVNLSISQLDRDQIPLRSSESSRQPEIWVGAEILAQEWQYITFSLIWRRSIR